MSKIPIYYDPSYNSYASNYNDGRKYFRDKQDSYVVQINSITRIIDIVSISKEAKEKAAGLNQKNTSKSGQNSGPEDWEQEELSARNAASQEIDSSEKFQKKFSTADYAEKMYKLNSSLYK